MRAGQLTGPITRVVRLFCTAIIALLCLSGGYGRAESGARFPVEIHAAGERGPTFIVTNRSEKALTAGVLEMSSSTQVGGKSTEVWDAVLQDAPVIAPGGQLTQDLARVVGGPLPDKVEVVAGIWADGETFGQPAWVRIILRTRAMRAAEFDEASAILKKGLEREWSTRQYLEALGDEKSGPMYSIRAALAANGANADKPRTWRRLLQVMFDDFAAKAERIRQAKPAISNPPLAALEKDNQNRFRVH